MSILLTKAQKVAGFDCPNGTLVIGLEKDVEALAAQGGGALPLDIGLVSNAGNSGGPHWEPAATATFTAAIDESLLVTSGNALDVSTWRTTAVPAGSRGRVTAVGDKLREAGVDVRFQVKTMQFDLAFTILPSDRAVMDAAAKNLARQGYNAVRLMGIEHFVMSGMTGAATFNAEYVDRFDYWLASCKREGLYWIGCVMSYNGFEDMAGATNRFAYTESSNTKPRMYTEQSVRDNWALGVSRLYNRVNPHTGSNMMQDPALLLFELYNEQSTTFCANAAWPTRWLARVGPAAAQTWGEWLADTTKAHGYANLAALNASWGTAHASYAAAAATAMPAQTNAMAQTQQNIDGILYCQYLEDDMAAYYAAKVAEWGMPCLTSYHTMYTETMEARGTQKYSVNSLGNWHAYQNIAYNVQTGVPTTDPDNAIWESERVTLCSPMSSGSKPVWMGEVGNHSYSRWRHQFPVHIAAAASQGAVAMAWFDPSDPFTTAYDNDTTLHGDRTRRLDSFPSLGAYAHDFIRVMKSAMFLRGDVGELTTSQSLVLNNRYGGVSPRATGRISRTHSTLFQPLQLLAALTKLRLGWTEVTTDDTLAATFNLKDWKTILTDAQTATQIGGAHPSLVSANANAGAVVSVATTGTVGGLTATAAQPVFDLGGNTLVTGDLIHVTNLTGSVGTWPGTNNRASRAAVVKGTGNYVQLVPDATRNVSGCDLTGLSGANFTAGAWCEGANVLESGHGQWGMSRRLKRAFVNTSKTVFFTHTAATLPATFGAVIVSALDQHSSLFVTSLDGAPIATSSRLLIGICGEAINTGMTLSVDGTGKQTITATGDYPVQHRDITAELSLALTPTKRGRLYRLQRNGNRYAEEAAPSIDSATGRLVVKLRTGTNYPACFFELVR
ncbi:hypothetical protein PEC18_12110 [Paucibacter sp. O1-1]|nr:hypothetical protein [Paucibacter sp. O1-1]MDA3826560.1 hypothetical protein [Paucibacter sp. O1-1]